MHKLLSCSVNFFLFDFIKIHLFLAVLGLHCLAGFPLVASSGGYSELWCTGFSQQWLLLQSAGSRRPRTSVAAA